MRPRRFHPHPRADPTRGNSVLVVHYNDSIPLMTNSVTNIRYKAYSSGNGTSTTTTRYEKTRSGLLLQLRTVHHGRLALVRCQLQNPPTSYLVGQRVVVVLEAGTVTIG